MKKSLIGICFTMLLGFTLSAYGEEPKPIELEKKALIYFCENIHKIKPQLNDFQIRFNGKTEGVPSCLFQISHCLKTINLFKDSIPNRSLLDSLNELNSKNNNQIIDIGFPDNCQHIKKAVFDPFYGTILDLQVFNMDLYYYIHEGIWSLHVYNVVKLNDIYYVEFLLLNKLRSNVYKICIEFDNDFTPVNIYNYYYHYSGYKKSH